MGEHDYFNKFDNFAISMEKDASRSREFFELELHSGHCHFCDGILFRKLMDLVQKKVEVVVCRVCLPLAITSIAVYAALHVPHMHRLLKYSP